MFRGRRQSGKRTARPGRPPHHLPQGAQQDCRGATQGDSTAEARKNEPLPFFISIFKI